MINLKLPTQEQIKAARKAAGLTQQEAADKVGMSLKSWKNWESYTSEHRQMNIAIWKLFLKETRQFKKYLENSNG